MKRKNQVEPQDSLPDSWKRRHGFQPPLHPQQLTGWLLLFAAAFFIHTIQIPSLPFNMQIPLQVITALLLTVLFCAMLRTSLCNCEDFGNKTIEDDSVKCQWCHIILTSSQTKHCSLCNKCIQGFDHHCKWLNQCIGSRNYFHFVISITSACILCVAMFLLSVVEISLLYVCSDGINCISPRFLYNVLDPVLFTFLSGIFFLLSALGSGLLIHLCAFHAYIKWNGWTTYEYIRQQLEKESNSFPPNYFINKTKKRWWSQCPCFACYDACRNKNRFSQTHPTTPIFALSSTSLQQGGVSSILLQQALNSMVYIHPSLPSAIRVADDHRIGPLKPPTAKVWRPPKVPKIIRTSPSVEASSEWWNNLSSHEPSKAVHLLTPA